MSDQMNGTRLRCKGIHFTWLLAVGIALAIASGPSALAPAGGKPDVFNLSRTAAAPR